MSTSYRQSKVFLDYSYSVYKFVQNSTTADFIKKSLKTFLNNCGVMFD